MATWSPDQYLKFGDERTRPFIDLLSRIGHPDARYITDLGCGPGNGMPALQAMWPRAQILGVDSSPEMIERARDANDPQLTYQLADITDWSPPEPIELIVSNATFQWVPDHDQVLLQLADLIPAGGVFAFQMPLNQDAPSHALMRAVAATARYADFLRDVRRFTVGDAEHYLHLLSRPGWRVDAWETTYLHVLPGEDAVYEWVSGTGVRPYLQALPEELRAEFAGEYRAALRTAYPRTPIGTVLPFRRVFAVAHREH